jgi:uncharacterized membrane protein
MHVVGDSWLIGFHIIGIILWMGGLFGLTMHAGVHTTLENSPRPALKIYESKSYFMGSLPGLILTVGTGLWMLLQSPAAFLSAEGAYGSTFHVKLLLVVILIVVDQVFLMRLRKFHAGGEGSRKLFMALHGTVGLCFIIIVLLMTTRILA